MRKTLTNLVACSVVGILLVLGLFLTTNTIVRAPNSFLRTYKKFTVQKLPVIDIGYSSFYLAGITQDKIYLGNITAPFNVLVSNHSLTDTQHIKLHIRHKDEAMVHASTTVKIKTPYFYLADGYQPTVYRGKIGEWLADTIGYDCTAYFSQLAPISNNSFAIRTTEHKKLNNVLGKVQANKPRIQLNKTLLQKQMDGIFSTDGTLQYNSDLNWLVYTYRYRNQFIVSDTNLNLLYRGHTLDTISIAQIRLGVINSENSTTLIDKNVTNWKTCTAGQYLFIASNLQAKNDAKELLDNNTIVDVYNLKNDSYQFSFLIRNYMGKKARDFMIYNNVMVALFDHYMIKYSLHNENLSIKYQDFAQ